MSKAASPQKSISVWALGIIAVVGLANYAGTVVFGGDEFSIDDAWFLLAELVCAFFAFLVSRRYRGSDVFGRAYLFLGLAFVSWFMGDLMYYYLKTLGMDPYPSPFDAFYIASYVFAALHLIINSRYFKRQWSPAMKVWLVACPIIITTIYIFVAAAKWGEYDELPFDLAYGGIFVFGVSVLLALATIGASVFRQSILGTVWLLLAGGIFLWALADVWYYYTEIFFEEGEQLASSHPLNSIWMAAFATITYALVKHRKSI